MCRRAVPIVYSSDSQSKNEYAANIKRMEKKFVRNVRGSYGKNVLLILHGEFQIKHILIYWFWETSVQKYNMMKDKKKNNGVFWWKIKEKLCIQSLLFIVGIMVKTLLGRTFTSLFII